MSFQTNSRSSGIRARAYVDFSPEGTDHIYMFNLVDDETEPLSRIGYDVDLFETAVLSYEVALAQPRPDLNVGIGGHVSIALTQDFADSNVTLGIPFSVWRDSKLTQEQRAFFSRHSTGLYACGAQQGLAKLSCLPCDS